MTKKQYFNKKYPLVYFVVCSYAVRTKAQYITSVYAGNEEFYLRGNSEISRSAQSHCSLRPDQIYTATT